MATATKRKPMRSTPKRDAAARALATRPSKGFTVSEFADKLGISRPAANMMLIRLHAEGKARIAGSVQAVRADGQASRYAKVYKPA